MGGCAGDGGAESSGHEGDPGRHGVEGDAVIDDPKTGKKVEGTEFDDGVISSVAARRKKNQFKSSTLSESFFRNSKIPLLNLISLYRFEESAPDVPATSFNGKSCSSLH